MGWLFIYCRPNVKYDKRLLQAQQEAMKTQKGLWRNWKEEQGRYIGNQNSRCFHLATCPLGETFNGKIRPHFPLNGMPSTPVTPRQKNASKNFGVMSERK